MKAHISRSVPTTSEGLYRIALLLLEVYTVMMSANGFAENTASPIQVTVSETSSLNVTLTIAEPQQPSGVDAWFVE
jgi:hypothetical protein